MRLSARISLLVATLLTSTEVPGQLQLFSGAAFEHEVSPTWGYELEVEHRQVVNTGSSNRVLVTAAVNRLLANGLSVTPGFRTTPYYGNGPTEIRLFTDINYDYPLGDGPFSLEARLRSQYEFELTENQSLPQIAVRPRLGVVFSAHSTTDLIAEVETRYRFDAIDAITQYRYTFGVSVALSTRLSIESFLRLEQERLPKERVMTTGILLNYVLPDRRHRDWRYRRPFGRSLLW